MCALSLEIKVFLAIWLIGKIEIISLFQFELFQPFRRKTLAFSVSKEELKDFLQSQQLNKEFEAAKLFYQLSNYGSKSILVLQKRPSHEDLDSQLTSFLVLISAEICFQSKRGNKVLSLVDMDIIILFSIMKESYLLQNYALKQASGSQSKFFPDKNLQESSKNESTSTLQKVENANSISNANSKKGKRFSFWAVDENKRYAEFIKRQTKLFELSLEERRTIKINNLISQHVKTRTPFQCRSHHQKMLKYHKDLKGIVQYIDQLQKFEEDFKSEKGDNITDKKIVRMGKKQRELKGSQEQTNDLLDFAKLDYYRQIYNPEIKFIWPESSSENYYQSQF